jgi:hypothetical protein
MAAQGTVEFACVVAATSELAVRIKQNPAHALRKAG